MLTNRPNAAVISLLKDVVAVLHMTLDELEPHASNALLHLLENRLMRAQVMVDHLRGEPSASNSPIEALLADYEMTGSTLTDIKLAAARYSYTMPDSQARCILHIVGHSSEIKDKEEKDV